MVQWNGTLTRKNIPKEYYRLNYSCITPRIYSPHLRPAFTPRIYAPHLHPAFTPRIYAPHLRPAFTPRIYAAQLCCAFTPCIYAAHLRRAFTQYIYYVVVWTLFHMYICMCICCWTVHILCCCLNTLSLCIYVYNICGWSFFTHMQGPNNTLQGIFRLNLLIRVRYIPSVHGNKRTCILVDIYSNGWSFFTHFWTQITLQLIIFESGQFISTFTYPFLLIFGPHFNWSYLSLVNISTFAYHFYISTFAYHFYISTFAYHFYISTFAYHFYISTFAYHFYISTFTYHFYISPFVSFLHFNCSHLRI